MPSKQQNSRNRKSLWQNYRVWKDPSDHLQHFHFTEKHYHFTEWVRVSEVAQSCPTLCDPVDCSLPGSSIHGLLQARILERVAISFPNACMHAKSLQSYPTLCDPLDKQPTRLLCPQDYPSKNTGVGCHFLLQGIFPIQGWHPPLLHWQANSLSLSHQGSLLTYILDTKPGIKVRKSVLKRTRPTLPTHTREAVKSSLHQDCLNICNSNI